MWRSTKVQTVALAAICGVLGYVAASTDVFRTTVAAPSAAELKTSTDPACDKESCCSSELDKAKALVAATQRFGSHESGPERQEAEHRLHHGRRHRHVEHRRLPPRHDGRADAEPRQAGQGRHAVHRLLRRGELHGGSRELHHRPVAHPHRHDHGRPGGRQDRPARRRPARSPPRSRRRATPPASSARTTWATATSSCPPSTASTNSSATCITSTRWKTRRIRTIRRIC